MGSTGWLILYSIAVVAASLLGGAIPALVGMTHRRLQFGLSFVSGVMLGVAVFHMIPHALVEGVSVDGVMLAVALGFVAMFLLERFAHFHQHEPPQPACDSPDHGHAGHHHPPASGVGRLTWAGAAVGLTIHTLLEGVALASSVVAVMDADTGAVPALAGFATFLVIVLHKPFDSLTLGTLFRAGGGTRAQLLAVNVGFAALVPVGVVLFLIGVRATGDASQVVPYVLAFSAGTFLCIAASDLLPEVQFHRHDRVGLSVALMVGLALAWGIGQLEHSMHDHDHGGHDHAHDGHDHAHGEHDHPHGEHDHPHGEHDHAPDAPQPTAK